MVLPQSVQKIENGSTAMDVDPNDAYTPVTQEGNDDIDLDEEDTLDEFGDME